MDLFYIYENINPIFFFTSTVSRCNAGRCEVCDIGTVLFYCLDCHFKRGVLILKVKGVKLWDSL